MFKLNTCQQAYDFNTRGANSFDRVFLSRNYRLIVAPRKLDVLKTNLCPRSKYDSYRIEFLKGV